MPTEIDSAYATRRHSIFSTVCEYPGPSPACAPDARADQALGTGNPRSPVADGRADDIHPRRRDTLVRCELASCVSDQPCGLRGHRLFIGTDVAQCLESRGLGGSAE